MRYQLLAPCNQAYRYAEEEEALGHNEAVIKGDSDTASREVRDRNMAQNMVVDSQYKVAHKGRSQA